MSGTERTLEQGIVTLDGETEAEVRCRRALRAEPICVNALYVLGCLRSDRGDVFEAIRLFREAISAKPNFFAVYPPLVQACYELGWMKEAAKFCSEWALGDPENPEMRHMMAAVTGENVPERCSDAYIKSHFNRFSRDFDSILLKRLDYRGPEIIAMHLRNQADVACSPIDVLDAGCGTGLCGLLIRSYCGTLTGVDLASDMIEKARQRRCYDELIVGELCTAMDDRREMFDAIVSADVLIYFGRLEVFMRSAYAALRPGGQLIATTELLSDITSHSFRLQASGRYCHRESYVRRAIREAGFEIVTMNEELIRWELGKRVMGHAFVARRC